MAARVAAMARAGANPAPGSTKENDISKQIAEHRQRLRADLRFRAEHAPTKAERDAATAALTRLLDNE